MIYKSCVLVSFSDVGKCLCCLLSCWSVLYRSSRGPNRFMCDTSSSSSLSLTFIWCYSGTILKVTNTWTHIVLTLPSVSVCVSAANTHRLSSHLMDDELMHHNNAAFILLLIAHSSQWHRESYLKILTILHLLSDQRTARSFKTTKNANRCIFVSLSTYFSFLFLCYSMWKPTRL